MRHIGLEIFYDDPQKASKSVFFAFKESASVHFSPFLTALSESARNAFFQSLSSQSTLDNLQHENQNQVTFRWQCGLVSNYEYALSRSSYLPSSSFSFQLHHVSQQPG